MRTPIAFFIVITLLGSCSDKRTTDSGIYLGTYRVGDRLIPYPFIIKKESDSIFLFDDRGVCIDKIADQGIRENDEIKFKEKHLKVLDQKEDYLIVFDVKDTSNFRTYRNGKPNSKYAAKFQILAAGNQLDVLKIKNEMKNFIWKYNVIEDEKSNPNHDLEIEQQLNFKKDSVSILTNYLYQGEKTISERETKAYYIFKIDDIYFLSLQNGPDNPQPIYRITGYDSQKIELQDYSSRVSKSISFYKDSIELDEYKEEAKNAPKYSNCYEGYQGEYHYEDITFNKGNQYIADYVNENLPSNEIKSGYIIIHFNINCVGNVGDFGLIQMNSDFEETAFSNEIVKHIINSVSELKDFPAPESQREWLNFKDVHAFLMFKLDHGKITDVCP